MNVEDFFKVIVLLVAGISIMSSISQLPNGSSLGNLGVFLIVMAMVVGILSIIIPFLKRFF